MHANGYMSMVDFKLGKKLVSVKTGQIEIADQFINLLLHSEHVLALFSIGIYNLRPLKHQG